MKKNKYQISYSKKYKRDYKKIVKAGGYDLKKLNFVINELAAGKKLDAKFKDHQLKGALKNFRECHIEPDWLLVYEIHEDILILHLHRTGNHSSLF